MGRERCPGDREIRDIGIGAGFKGDQRHAFTAKPRRAGGDGGLVGKGGNDTERIATGDVFGGEDGRNVGAGLEAGQVADDKGGMGVGRADGLDDQRTRRRVVGTETVACDLGGTVKARDGLADGVAAENRLCDG